MFFNLLSDSKELAAFLQIGKHFEKMIRPQNFDEKKNCKVGKPCLFTFRVAELRVARANF